MKNNTLKTFISIFLSILILLGSQILSELIASIFVLIKVPTFICNIIAGFLYVFLSYKLLKLLCVKYLKSNLEDYYIPKFKLDIKWFIIGLFLPLIITVIYLLLPGSFVKVDISLLDKLSLITSGIFFFGLGAGIVEEMVFRGIIMNALDKRYNKVIAVIIPSILFGFVHVIGTDFNFLSCLLVILSGTMVGIMFSLIASLKCSIWNSAIVHILWNMIIVGGIISIGTTTNEYSIFNYILNTNSILITGGDFGIESSLIALLFYFLISLITYRFYKKI